MAAMRIMITALLLPTPSTSIKTTCDIPSVEAGSNATLTTYFDEDMRNAKAKDYTVMHQRQNSSELEMLSCHFTNGDVECDKTPCCTWERHVTDVFRVYIHNVSQEHEGRFWGLVSPAEGDDQTFCRFALKGDTCSIDFINATNNYVNCSSMPVTIGHTCDVSCSNGFFIDGSQTSITYKCIGKNKWSPESRDLSCNEKIETANMLWLLFLLILIIILPLGYFIMVRLRRKRKETEDADTEDAKNKLLKEEIVKGYSNQDIMCHPKLKLRKVSYTDMRDDRNLQRLLNDLLEIADNDQEQNMKLVLSQFQVDNNVGHSTYSAAVAPPPQTKSLNKEHCIKGEFNILILHSHCQLFILQISRVGEECFQDETTEDDVLIKEVYKMTKELTMAEERLTNLKSGVKTNITKCLVMPNIKSNQLKRAVDGNHDAKQALCLCLGVRKVKDAVKRSLMSDQFSDEKTSSDVNQTIKEWWQYIVRATSSTKTQILPSEEDRLFCPDSTIRLHDFEERTKTNGERMVELTLTQDLVKILREKDKYAFICGPPGTGKSVLLALMALQHLENGDKVYIINTVFENIASSMALKYMLKKNNRRNKHNVQYLHYNLEKYDANNEKVIDIINKAAETNTVFAITDEIWAISAKQVSGYFRCIKRLKIQNVSIWGTCKLHDIIYPEFHNIALTVPLRYPGKVLEEVEKSLAFYTEEKMHIYTTKMPLQNLCDGPDIITIDHREHLQNWPTNCEDCGKAVATFLKDLGIGEVAGNLNTHDDDENESTPPLTYRDVFVLTQNTDLQADNGIVSGLRESGISKVRVLKNNCSREEIKEVVLARNNEVTVAYYLTVLGLQRKVVVFLPHRNKDDNYPDNEIKAYGRCLGMSRCTSQLIVVQTALS